MRKLFVLSLFMWCLNLFGQQVEWYLPWENRLNHLIKDDSSDYIPIVLEQENYRILKINLEKGVTLEQLYFESEHVNVNIFYLPVINDYNNEEIVDVLLPFEDSILQSDLTKYFFVEFKGIKTGFENLALNIKTNDGVVQSKKNIFVSQRTDEYLFSINTWAYLEYDFLVKGLKDMQVEDLSNSRNNFLLIPHSYFPKVEKNIDNDRIDKLKSFLLGTEDKFQYYVLYFDYRKEYTSILSDKWKSAFLDWINIINNVFEEYGIPKDRVLLYPYDEPQGETIQKAEDFIDWVTQQHIKNPLYITIGGKDREKALYLSKKYDYVQVAYNLANKANNIKNKQTTLFLYTVWGKSRSVRPKNYLSLVRLAYLNDAKGVGVWSYSGMKGAVDSFVNTNETPSWKLPIVNEDRDYSLVYRYKNKLYSSIRWKALAYTYNEYNFLKLYESKLGKNKTEKFISKYFENQENWEREKLNFYKKYYN